MKTATVTDFRANMKERLQEIVDDKDILILTGPKNDYVVLALEDYNAMKETQYLLSSPVNGARLMESIAQDSAGEYVQPRTIVVKKPRQSSVRSAKKKAGKTVKSAAKKRK
jgi:antitoxin YefM